MALTVSLLGVNYSIPEPGDVGYDQQLTNYLKALSTAFPQLSGGAYALTAELDLGASFGVKQLYMKTETATPATVGVVRLAKTDAVGWRNNANSADLALKIDTADALTFNGNNVTGNPFLGANTATPQSIPNGLVDTIVVFGTVERDSDSAYNSTTGRFTVPTGKGGDYLITSNVGWGTAANTPRVLVYKNAAAAKTLNNLGVGTLINSQGGSAMLNLAAGDVIDIRAAHNSGGAISLTAIASINYFSIKRIPT